MIVLNPTTIELMNNNIELFNNIFELFSNVLSLLIALYIEKNRQKKDENN